MRVGLFTDTYFPQVSGVATSIRTLKEELEKSGHEVYIFTTTDKDVARFDDPTIIRLPSMPFISFTDRRMVYRGFFAALKLAKHYELDIIHTQTEFGVGMFGKWIGRALKIPVVHTYHTQYEDYVHYIAKGKVITPSMVKYLIRDYLTGLDGVICPSRIVQNVLDDYDIKLPKRVIPTGIVLDKYDTKTISPEVIQELRENLGISSCETMLLSLSRISFEKNIQAVIKAMATVVQENKTVKLVVVGDGPYLAELKNLVAQLQLTDKVIFTGMVNPDQTRIYYVAADFFVSASTSETQGLTYTESLACGTPIIAHGNPYLDDLIEDKMFGTLYYREADLADAILDALIDTPEMKTEALEQKLYQISSEHFGKSVHQFYLDLMIAKDSKKRDKLSLTIAGSKTDRSIRLVKSTVKFPAKLVKKTAKTSVKVIKTPFKLAKNLRDFLD